MWKRTIDGKALHFRLVGINNQNFLMRDEETGSWWQQITGKAIFGPLKGRQLDTVLSDEITFGQWKAESPAGQVLAPLPKYSKEDYDPDWEPKVQKLMVPVNFPGTPLQSRDILLGIQNNGLSRAYPLKIVLEQSPLQDRLGGLHLVLVAGADKASIRAFIARIDGADADFFRKTGTDNWALVDSLTGSEWNFQGCATAGPALGKCLLQIQFVKDYWFDWRNYHPDTSVYQH